jgi:hypothetical protein
MIGAVFEAKRRFRLEGRFQFMQRLLRPRTTAQLSKSIHQQLNMYAPAAGAAGVGMLALAVPAEAKIVYTPAHEQIPPGFGLSLDLNHDGINDFSFVNFYSKTSSTIALWVSPPNPGNGVFSHLSYAADLPAGVKIGPKGHFRMRSIDVMVSNECQNGPWKDAHDRYLGLTFEIKGKTHFGWARLNVRCVPPKALNATLTGYAYETIPDKPIITGKTTGPNASVEPATLGHLAQGADAISIWRVEQIPDQAH